MRERDIESWAVRKAVDAGWYVRKFTTPARRSAPDRIFGKADNVFWIEFKAPGEKPTPLQAAEHGAMRAFGLRVYVCDSREGFHEIMRGEDIAWLW
jgi:hypothetical protein